jgi:hypothetical protein
MKNRILNLAKRACNGNVRQITNMPTNPGNPSVTVNTMKMRRMKGGTDHPKWNHSTIWKTTEASVDAIEMMSPGCESK